MFKQPIPWSEILIFQTLEFDERQHPFTPNRVHPQLLSATAVSWAAAPKRWQRLRGHLALGARSVPVPQAELGGGARTQAVGLPEKGCREVEGRRLVFLGDFGK